VGCFVGGVPVIYGSGADQDEIVGDVMVVKGRAGARFGLDGGMRVVGSAHHREQLAH
jgi:hypothetical protein